MASPSASSAIARTSSAGPVLLALSVGTTSFAFATCMVRFCVRLRVRGSGGWDDFAVAGAMTVGLVGAIFSILESLSLSQETSALQFDFLAQPWLSMASALSHISICLYFFRIVGKQRPWSILLGVIIVALASVNLVNTLTSNLQCRPLEKLWIPAVAGVCWNPNIQLGIGYGQAAFAIFTDFFLALFPVMIVRDLDMQRRLRWPFYTLSFLSFGAGICAIVRTYEISVMGAEAAYTYEMLCAQILANLEMNLGIIAANILPLGSLGSRQERLRDGLATPRKDPESNLSNGTSSTVSSLKRPATQDDSEDSRRETTLIIQGAREVNLDLPIEQPPLPPIPKMATMFREEDDDDLAPGSNPSRPTIPTGGGSVRAAREAARHSLQQSARDGPPRPDKASVSALDDDEPAAGVVYNNTDAHLWGIWKTVSVQVVNEEAEQDDIAIVQQGPRRGSKVSKTGDQEWQTILRGSWGG